LQIIENALIAKEEKDNVTMTTRADVCNFHEAEVRQKAGARGKGSFCFWRRYSPPKSNCLVKQKTHFISFQLPAINITSLATWLING